MIKTVINPEFEHLRKELSSIPETIAVCGTKIFQGRNRIYRATIDADILPNLYDGVTMGAFPDMQAALDEVAAQIDELIKDAGY